MLRLGLAGRLEVLVAWSPAIGLVSVVVLPNRCFGLMVYKVHQSMFRVAPAVTTRVKHTIRLIGNKESK